MNRIVVRGLNADVAIANAEAAAVEADAAAASAVAAQGAADSAAASAAASAETASEIALGDADATLATAIDNPASQTAQALSATIADRVAGTMPLPLRGVASAAETTRPVDVLADGVLYGVNGSDALRKSTNSGASWTTVQAAPGNPVYGTVVGLRDLGNGEVLLVRQFGLYRSVGWATNPATATWTAVLETSVDASFYPWGVDTNPDTGRIVATQYPASVGGDWTASRYVWLSQNFGVSISVIFDVNNAYPSIAADTHMHFVALDKFGGDRIWFSWHDRAQTLWQLLYTDDFGGSFNALATNDQPTVGVSTPAGMVFATDGLANAGVGVNGLYHVRRTTVPADQRYELAWEWPGSRASELQGFGFRGFYDPASGLAYIGFVVDGGSSYPVIAASDGIVAAGVYESPTASATTSDGFQNVMVTGHGKLVATQRMGGVWTTLTAEPAARGSIPASSEDPGRVLGGRATQNQTTAVGFNAKATANTQATAVGVDSVASGGGAVAVGFSADATLGGNVAVGRNAQATHAASVVVGEDAASQGDGATAIGRSTDAGISSVTVGNEAQAGDQSVVIGANAVGTVVSTVVGHLATGGAYGAVFGYHSHVNVTRGTALGAQAIVGVGHDKSVAIGDQTATTGANQVAVGPRYFEFSEVTAGLGNAPANSARLWVEDNGAGLSRLMVRFSSGPPIVIKTDGDA